MKHNLFSLVLSLFLFFVLVGTTACAALPSNYAQPINGGGVPIRPETVIYGIAQAIADKPGVVAFQSTQNPGQFVIAWYNTYGASFFGADVQKYKTLTDMKYLVNQGGTLINAKNADEFLEFMKSNGWKAIPGSALPKVFADIVRTASFPAWMTTGSTTLTMPLLMFSPNINPDYCSSGLATDLMYSVLCQDDMSNKS